MVDTETSLWGKSFVNFIDVNVLVFNTDFLQYIGDGKGWADSHNGGVDSNNAISYEFGFNG